jgi:hypothetical protein
LLTSRSGNAVELVHHRLAQGGLDVFPGHGARLLIQEQATNPFSQPQLLTAVAARLHMGRCNNGHLRTQ